MMVALLVVMLQQTEDLVMTPAILLTFPRPIDRHPNANLLPTSHHGFDLEDRPIYWEVRRAGGQEEAILYVRGAFSSQHRVAPAAAVLLLTHIAFFSFNTSSCSHCTPLHM
jgi:hypothetical protein